mgnify:CR=1 FL=1
MSYLGNPDFQDPFEDEPIVLCEGCEDESEETRKEWGNMPITYHPWSRTDYNGFFTGCYCESCYNSKDKYPYRKDNYNADAIANGEDIWGEE